ncbi:MAG: hypothetical protein Q7S87_11215 [Agitococcus sp.]|nr:hypothetical protein [Agitococcus sp.]
MKMLKKLALVSAVSMISAGAFAMEAMDDESMASATGQDGITILVKPGVIDAATATSMNVSAATQNIIDNAATGYYANSDDNFAGLSIGSIVVHDDDGLTAAGTPTGNSGALVIGGGLGAVTALQDRTVLLADGSSPIKIDIDMVGDIDGAGAGGAMLNVVITTPRLAIKTGDIYVANSNSANAGRDADGNITATAEVDGTTHSDKIKIMSGLELVLGAASTTIQLGSESQGHMVVANTSLIGGLTINNLEVFDAGGVLNPTLGTVVTTGGSFFASSLSIKDAGGANLSVISNVDIGSANTSVFTGAASNKVADGVIIAGGGGALVAAAYGVNGIDDGGAGDDSAVDYATLTGTRTAVVAGATYLTIQGSTQAAYNGLVIEMAQFGHATNGADLAINNIRLGSATAATLGDVQILGLNINGTVAVISGH